MWAPDWYAHTEDWSKGRDDWGEYDDYYDDWSRPPYDRRRPYDDRGGYDRYGDEGRDRGPPARRDREPKSERQYSDQPKLHIGGGLKEVGQEEFEKAMGQFGEILDCIIMPGGFGFCTFKDEGGTEAALEAGKITIHGKVHPCHKANKKRGDRDRDGPRDGPGRGGGGGFGGGFITYTVPRR
jgi:hypothetical protein